MVDSFEIKEFHDDYFILTISYGSEVFIDHRIDIQGVKNEVLSNYHSGEIDSLVLSGFVLLRHFFHCYDEYVDSVIDYSSLLRAIEEVIKNYGDLYIPEDSETSSDCGDDEVEAEENDCEEGDEVNEPDFDAFAFLLKDPDEEKNSLFDEKKFCRFYPSLDDSKENDKKVKKIHDALSGEPEFKEYTEEFIDEMRKLFSMYPNFKEYENCFIPSKELLSIRTDKIIRMDNILIVGNPSCGKSSFINRMCEIYKNFYRISLGNGSVNFTLMGGDKGYDKSECGDILRSMFKVEDAPIANPLVVLDEIDKICYSGGTDRDFSGTFSILLEKNNAKYFSDNFFKVEVDASNINYIAIANDISGIPAHVLSRFPTKIFVRDYTEEEIETVVLNNQYKEWLDRNKISNDSVPPSIPERTRKLIFECSHGHPREVPAVLAKIVEKSIKDSFASLTLPEKEENEIRLLFNPANLSKNRKIGFR